MRISAKASPATAARTASHDTKPGISALRPVHQLKPLFFYVKQQHIGVIPGLKEFAEFFVSDEVAGPDGPLAAYGLVSDPELAKTQEDLAAMTQ